ncbi:MAG: hypothetical protein R3A10_00575 [Caldilineaceae bacterium]
MQQTLLPPHQIFVHLTLPTARPWPRRRPASTGAGEAPTGSWLPGEYLSTRHRGPGAGYGHAVLTLRIGLYNSTGNVRLPVTVQGAFQGRCGEIPLSGQ